YPLPAALLVIPVAWLSVHIAAGIAVGSAATLLAFAVTRDAWWPLVMFLSAPALRIADSVQIWAPVFTAAAILGGPMLGVIVCKPHVGLPMIAYQTRWRPLFVGGFAGLVLIAVSI